MPTIIVSIKLTYSTAIDYTSNYCSWGPEMKKTSVIVENKKQKIHRIYKKFQNR